MDQLAEYRARQQQRFEAQQQRQEVVAQVEPQRLPQTPPRLPQDTARSRGPRPSALCADELQSATDACPGTPREYQDRHKQRFAELQAKRQAEQAGYFSASHAAATTEPQRLEPTIAACSSTSIACPGTPREYREQHQQRFADMRVFSLRDDHSSSSVPEPEATPPSLEVLAATASSSASSPGTPRLRGSASLRAISAARAMREATAAPLPGAAWPGHAQNATEAVPSRSSTSLPPRPPTPSKIAGSDSPSSQASTRPPTPATPPKTSPDSSPSARRPRSCALPPRPRSSSSRNARAENPWEAETGVPCY